MATNVTEEQLKLTVNDQTATTLNAAKGRVKSLRGSVNKLGESFKSNASTILAATGAIAGGIFAVKKAFDFADEFARFQQNQLAFNSQVTALGGNATKVFNEIKAASGGLIDNNALLKSANTAISLGISVQVLGDMLQVSRAKARDMGITTQEAFEKLTIALARGSKLRLDDLGIIIDSQKANEKYAASIDTTVDKLNDQQKALAFNIESLRLGAKALDRYNLEQNTLTENLQEFKATMANARVQAGSFFLRIGTFGVSMIQDGMDVMLRFAAAVLTVGRRMAELTDKIGLTENAAQSWQIQIDASIAAADEAAKKSLQNTKLALSSTAELLKAQEAALKRPPPTIEGAAGGGDAAAAELAQAEFVQEELRRIRLINQESELADLDLKLFQIDNFYSVSREKLVEHNASVEEIEELQALKVQAIAQVRDEAIAKSEAQALKKRLALARIETQAREKFERNRLGTAANVAKSLFEISNESNRDLFEASKGFSIAVATVNAYVAASEAFKNPPGPPWSYATAAAALVSGLANVTSISNARFGKGGGGSGAGVFSGGGGRAAAAGVPSAPQVPQAAPIGAGQTIDVRIIAEGPTQDSIIQKVTASLGEEIEDGRFNVTTVKT